MKWEDLQKEAAKIVANSPTGEFVDETFSTRSGTLRVMKELDVVHIAHDGHYNTVANGSTCRTHVTIRCRDTGTKDARDRTIYECENGTLFVWRYVRGDAYSFAFGSLESPVMQASPVA
jgi:hypothetical protein